MSSCHACAKVFGSDRALAQHQESTGHSQQKYSCDVCLKIFRSERALEQHQDSTGHFEQEHSCVVCWKMFKSEPALRQHQESTGHHDSAESSDVESETYSVPIPAPPVDTLGDWVLTEDFEGRKSFGYFVCRCGRFWLSAHAQPAFRMGCQGCEHEVLPYYMWQNHDKSKRNRRREEDDNKKPHDSSRCEACRRGVCDRGDPWE